jgi:hypothetical protein
VDKQLFLLKLLPLGDFMSPNLDMGQVAPMLSPYLDILFVWVLRTKPRSSEKLNTLYHSATFPARDWCLNSGLHTCKAGTLRHEPLCQSILLRYFGDGMLRTICLDWCQTEILPISENRRETPMPSSARHLEYSQYLLQQRWQMLEAKPVCHVNYLRHSSQIPNPIPRWGICYF